MLTDAVTNRSSSFRIPVFSCGSESNIESRIVVLRKSDEQNNLVQFHSDIRSDKIKILEKNPNSSMLFYDKDEKIQVRLKVEAIINHNNDITKQSWEKTQHISRKCYLVDNGPGTESDIPTSGLKPELDKFDYGFAVDWMRKDLKICIEEAKRNGSPVPVTEIVDGYYAEVQKMGGNRWDSSSLIARLKKKK